MREGTTVGRTVGGGVTDVKIVQIIDYQAIMDKMLVPNGISFLKVVILPMGVRHFVQGVR